MSLAKVFYLLKDAETRTGELYAMIGLNVSITHPELADLFGSLARDEELHARQIAFMQNVFLQSQDSFLEKPETEASIAEFMQNLEMTKSFLNQHFATVQPQDMIRLFLDLERNLVEKHRLLFLKAADPQVKNLLESLNLGDANHIKKLLDFQMP
jgi:hypothetical protein